MNPPPPTARPIFAIHPELVVKPALLGSRCPAEVKDREMRRLLAREAVLNLVLGCALAPMKAGLHVRLGAANWKDYCREHLGMSAPAATSLVERVQAVRDRPVLLRGLAEGRLGEEAASALLKSLPLDGSADSAWLSRARLPLHRLRKELDLAEQRGEFAEAAGAGPRVSGARGGFAEGAGAESGASGAPGDLAPGAFEGAGAESGASGARGDLAPGALEGGGAPGRPMLESNAAEPLRTGDAWVSPSVGSRATAGQGTSQAPPEPDAPRAAPNPLVDWICAHAKSRPAAARSQAAAPRGDGEWWVYCLTDAQYSELLICEEFASRVAGEELPRARLLEFLGADFAAGAPLEIGTPSDLRFEREAEDPALRDPVMAPDLEVLDDAWTLLEEDSCDLRLSGDFLQALPTHPHHLQRRLCQVLRCRQRLGLYFGRMLRLFHEDRLERKLGFQTLQDYAAGRLGLAPSTAFGIIRRDRDLDLADLWEEVRQGRLSLSQAELLVPLVIGDNRQEWVDFARRLPVRQLQAWVQAHQQLLEVAGDAWLERERMPPSPEERLEDFRAFVAERRKERQAKAEARLEGFRKEGRVPPEAISLWAAAILEAEREHKPRWHRFPPAASERWTFRRLPEPVRSFTLESLPKAVRPWIEPMLQGTGPWPLEDLPQPLARDLQVRIGCLRSYPTTDVRYLVRASRTLRTFCPEDLLPRVRVKVWIPDDLAPALEEFEAAVARELGRECTREECLVRWMRDFQATWSPAERQVAKARREFLARRGHGCEVPGCTCREGLEDHHVRFRSQGGGDEEWNRVLLCLSPPARRPQGLDEDPGAGAGGGHLVPGPRGRRGLGHLRGALPGRAERALRGTGAAPERLSCPHAEAPERLSCPHAEAPERLSCLHAEAPEPLSCLQAEAPEPLSCLQAEAPTARLLIPSGPPAT